MGYRLPLLSAFLPIALAWQLPVQEAWGEQHAAKNEVHDQVLARKALENGEILPLDRVIARLRETVSGEISRTELEKEYGIWIYEFKVIASTGQMVKVRIDAKTGELISKGEK